MKKLAMLLLAPVMIVTSWRQAAAQSSRSEKKAAKAAEIKKLVDSNKYVFVADYAIPQTGNSRQLTYPYDLRVTRDSIIAYLPYFGRAFLAPSPVDAEEGGIKFTSTDFKYSYEKHKNGSWDILIKPKDNNMANWRDVQQLRLNISIDGYASLQVISSNRDPISFEGSIVAKD